MKHSNLIKPILGLCLGLSMLTSCGKEEIAPRLDQSETTKSSEANTQPQGAHIELTLAGLYEFEDTLAEDAMRAFSLEQKNNIPQLKIEAKEYDITLYLRQLGRTEITQIPAKAVCSIDQSGSKKMKISVANFQLMGAGQKFLKDNTEWYVCGVIGTAPADEQTAQDEASSSLSTARSLPLGFPWTQLTINKDGVGEHKALRFNLIGTLLSAALRNNIVEAVEAYKVRLRSAGFAFYGSFDPSLTTDSDLQGGKYLAFKSSSANKTIVVYASEEAKAGNGVRITSGNEYTPTSPYFIWGYPVDVNSGIEAEVEVTTRPQGMTAEQLASSSLPSTEKKSFRRYSVPTTLRAPSGGYKHSFVHKAPFLITSDLMITEEYHYNKDHLNLSIIELHNPTLDPIYLRHYGLMKVGRDLTGNANAVAFFPQNANPVSGRSVDTGNKNGGVYQQAKIDLALIMPLELRDNDYTWSYWRWRTFVPFQQDGNDPNKTRFYTHRPQHKVIRTGASRGDGVISTTYAAPGEEPRLDPGKTMLILGPGYIEYTPDEDGYGILYPTKPLNTGGAGQQGQLGPGVQPIQSYIKGYCQYVFAMANYSATKSNSRNDAAATNHLAEDQGIVLVKQMLDPSSPLSNGTIRKVIDTAIPYNNAGSSLSQFQSKFPFGSANTHARVRVDGDYFPSTTFDIDNWYIANISWSNEVRGQWASREYYTERMTLGSRKFVQDGSKANQNNWGPNYTAPTKQW